MIVDGSQILMSYPFILVNPKATDSVLALIDFKNATTGTVVSLYSGCDWVFINDVVAYKTEDVEQIRFANVVYDVVPKQNILFTYIASLA